MSSAPVRRPDLDLLRVFACYLLLPFHVGMVFNPAPFFHVRNDESSFAFLVLCGFIGIWHMPLLFLLAGWSAAASLRSRGVGAFLGERARKLAVPLVAGCVLLMPVIKYIELRGGQDLNHRGLFVSEPIRDGIRSLLPVDLPLAAPFDETFSEFLPTFFTNLDRFTWSHLWFVAYLLVFTLALLPLLAPAARVSVGERRLAGVWVYFPMLPLVLVQLGLRERFPGPYNLYSDWANLLFFLVFLLAGFTLAVVPELEARLRAERHRLLALGTASTAVLLASVLGAVDAKAAILVASATAAWAFVAALFGYASNRFRRPLPGLSDLAESAFPVYVLHQPVVVLLAALVVTLPLGVFAKFGILLTGATAVTLLTLRFGVRPFAPMRFLLGMKPLTPGDRDGGRPLTATVRAGRRGVPVALAALLLAPGAAQASEPTGLWWAEGGFAQVEIVPCGEALCGRVVWLRHPFGEEGCALRDENNPEPDLRTRPVAGLTILRALRPAPDASGRWRGGEIYDPSSGRTYDAELQMDGADRLLLRGYLGVRLLGRTTTWVRVGSEGQCQAPA